MLAPHAFNTKAAASSTSAKDISPFASTLRAHVLGPISAFLVDLILTGAAPSNSASNSDSQFESALPGSEQPHPAGACVRELLQVLLRCMLDTIASRLLETSHRFSVGGAVRFHDDLIHLVQWCVRLSPLTCAFPSLVSYHLTSPPSPLLSHVSHQRVSAPRRAAESDAMACFGFSDDDALQDLPVLERLHLICEVLLMPVMMSSTTGREVAAFSALPDAARWVALRSDRGTKPHPTKEGGLPAEFGVSVSRRLRRSVRLAT
jgi:hypothetical protein